MHTPIDVAVRREMPGAPPHVPDSEAVGNEMLISSTAAFVSGTANAAYETSEAAMIGLAESGEFADC